MRRRLMLGLFVGLLLAGAATVLVFRLWNVGGLSAAQVNELNDRQLSVIARTASPLISALNRFRREHGSFPDQLSKAEISEGDWTYYPEGDGYSLSKKLGWDPMLQYFVSNNISRWVLDPGDGSTKREIDLNSLAR